MMPFEGALMDQPYMTFQILRIVQSCYKKHLNDEMKKYKAKMK